MCRAGVVLGLLVAAQAVAAQSAAAQEPSALPGVVQPAPALPEAARHLPRLEARLDSLLDVAAGLEARVEAERERYESSTRETLDAPVRRVAGGLGVLALPRDIETATALYETTWRQVFEPIFGAPPAALGEVQLGYYDHRGEWNPRIAEGNGMRYSVQVMNGLDDPRPQAVRAVMTALLREGPIAFYAWLGQAASIDDETDLAGFDPRSDLLGARRHLAATRSHTNVDCLDGDSTACAVSLGLRPEGWTLEEVARAWYDQETLREILTDRRWFRRADLGGQDRFEVGDASIDAAEYFTYRQRGLTVPEGASIDEADIVVLEGTEIFHDVAPASASTRMTLFTLAIELGGEGSVERWLELDPDVPLEEALEVVAGMPVDELAEEWRLRLGADTERPGGRLPVRATLGWVALLGVLSMTSTRWRLGR